MPKGTVADKHVRFSDSPKMDNSGLSVNEKREMFIGDKLKTVTGPVVTGGEMREAALRAGLDYGVTITDMASLQKISALVAKGSSVHNAAHDVAREYAFEQFGRDDSAAPRFY